MPNYCEIETESFGQLFSKCGTKEVAGRNSNTSSSAGDDYILVSSYGFDGFTTQHSGSLQTAGFSMRVNVQLSPPAIAAVFNVLNSKNPLKKLTLKIVDGVGTSRNVVVGQYIAENGILLSANIIDSEHKDSLSLLHLTMDFDKITFDDMLTNTSGSLITTGSGF